MRRARARALAAEMHAGFAAKEGEQALVPNADGGLAGVALGLGDGPGLWSLAGLPGSLPAVAYRLEDPGWDGRTTAQTVLGWALGSYRFERYRAGAARPADLVWPKGIERKRLTSTARAVALVRDLVNTPAGDMGPAELAEAARALGRAANATVSVIEGEALLRANYPMIHAVGRASARAPRLIDLVWGEEGAPKVTLVGKGVCFDSGGLDIKPSAAMRLMKKDMGGAATVLGLATMVMDAQLPVRLRVLVPAVENALGGDAFRPGDVLASRKGLSVEIGNTDAEGRLVLADALAEADREAPALLIDCATLTGAARSALGPDLPALFTKDDDLAADLARLGAALEDPVWRLPLWPGYDALLESPIADLNNISEGPFAGAITAALFLNRFVTGTGSYLHLDLYAWNQKPRPGRPVGGEAMAMRALYALIEERFGTPP